MFANYIQHIKTPMESGLGTFAFHVIRFANWTKILK